MRTLFQRVGALLLVLSGSALAQAPLTFGQVQELMGQENPVIQAQQASLDVSQALITQAGVTPNPVLQLQTQADGTERLSLIGLAVSKPFELGHKRQARIQAAERAHKEAARAGEERLHQLHFQLERRFLELLLAQEKEILTQESLAISERHLAIAEQRLAAGDISGAETAALRVERERRMARATVASGESAQARALLGELLLDPGRLAPGVTGELGWRGPLPPLEELLVTDEELIGLRVARAREATRESQIALEQANGVSDLTVQAGLYMQRVVFPGSSFSPAGAVSRLDDTGPLVQLQFQIPLPLGNDNSGNIAAAKARAEQARFETEALRRQLRAEIEGLYRKLLGQREARQRLEQSAKPAARAALETVEKAYSLGFRSQVDLILARDSYLQASEAVLEAAFAESLTLAELESLLGFSLSHPKEPPQ